MGWDDESSLSVLIDAPDEGSARAWGEEIAEHFVKALYKDEAVSWKKWNYASWVESSVEQGVQATAPAVAVGEFPDFELWLKWFADE
jgi:hypothetical protein